MNWNPFRRTPESIVNVSLDVATVQAIEGLSAAVRYHAEQSVRAAEILRGFHDPKPAPEPVPPPIEKKRHDLDFAIWLATNGGSENRRSHLTSCFDILVGRRPPVLPWTREKCREALAAAGAPLPPDL